jgi:hypothetical protein
MNVFTPAPAAAEPEDGFDALRRTFLVRLRGDQLRLTTLAATLARAGVGPLPILEELRHIGHRMRGAAAMFEFLDLASAANALEQAAGSTAAHATVGGASASTALTRLLTLLASMNARPVPAASERTEFSDRNPTSAST